MDTKELEKIEHYQDLAQESSKMWNMKVKVIPLVIGALGTIATKLINCLKKINIEPQIIELQKTATSTKRSKQKTPPTHCLNPL